MDMTDFNEAYGFNVVTADTNKMMTRAMELCDEHAAKYDEGSMEYNTFEALKVQCMKVLAGIDTPLK
jgi:hypothetical protein